MYCDKTMDPFENTESTYRCGWGTGAEEGSVKNDHPLFVTFDITQHALPTASLNKLTDNVHNTKRNIISCLKLKNVPAKIFRRRFGIIKYDLSFNSAKKNELILKFMEIIINYVTLILISLLRALS